MELQDRLARLRSFIWWTAPLYALFLFAGLYTSGFSWTVELGILLGVLVAFGFLDGLALLQLRTIEVRILGAESDLASTRDRLNRLARLLTWSGAGFAALFLVVLAMQVLA